jgi:hypothetical protein
MMIMPIWIGIWMRKQQIAIFVFALWLTIISVIMLLAQQIDVEILFFLSLLGVLVIVYLLELDFVEPRYLHYLWYLITLGIIIFMAIISKKILDMFGLEIVLP